MRFLSAIVCVATLFFSSYIFAAAIEVGPIRLHLSPKQPITSLSVRNHSNTPATLQLEAKRWTHKNIQDSYQDTRDILIAPPIITIPANSSQTVRVALRGSPDPQTELSYRLFLQEIPSQTQQQEGLNILLRIGVPIYVAPISPIREKLDWQATRLADNKLQVKLTNAGNTHVLVSELKLVAPNNIHTTEKLSSYIAPFGSETWTLSWPHSNKTVELHAVTDRGNTSAHLLIPSS